MFLRPDKPVEKEEISAKPLKEDKRDEGHVDVDYTGDSSEEETAGASNVKPLTGQDLVNHEGSGTLALSGMPTSTISHELSAHHEEKGAEGQENAEGQEDAGGLDSSDSSLSLGSDLIMNGIVNIEFPAAAVVMPVLNARSLMEIVEKKEISIKKPVNHNPQRQGLDDNLFDFGDALKDYTSDGGSIRVNQGLATLMLIAATAEAPNRLLMEKKREAFEQVTARAQSLLVKQREDYEKQREAIAKQHQEHLEAMRKQNELLQDEVTKTRELYAQTYLQFEVSPPSASVEESRALLVQATLARKLKN